MSKKLVDDLDKEIAEMESAVANRTEGDSESLKEPGTTEDAELDTTTNTDKDNDTEDHSDPDGDDDQVVEPSQEEEETDTAAESPKPDQTTPDAKQRENWKKRYTTTKAKLDGTIHTLRVENAALSSTITSLYGELDKVKNSLKELESKKQELPIDKRFTPEEREIIGDDALLALSRVTQESVKNATAPLEAELAKAAEERKKEMVAKAQATAQAAVSSFKSLLGRVVPDLEEIDSDPKFIEWLKEQNAHGVARMNLFKAAQSASDVERVSQFFNEYRAKVKGKASKIEAQITPEGSGSTASVDSTSSTDPTKRGWTQTSIDRFYDDIIAGKYRGKEKLQAQMEKDVDDFIGRSMKSGVPIPVR